MSEEDEVVTVCVEVIRGENERDVVVSLSTLENGIAEGQSNVKVMHETMNLQIDDDNVLLHCILQLVMTMEYYRPIFYLSRQPHNSVETFPLWMTQLWRVMKFSLLTLQLSIYL